MFYLVIETHSYDNSSSDTISVLPFKTRPEAEALLETHNYDTDTDHSWAYVTDTIEPDSPEARELAFRYGPRPDWRRAL